MTRLALNLLYAVLVGCGLLAAQSAHAATPVCGLDNGKVATGTPIPIGSINGVTGPDDFSSSAKAAAAYFKCVNQNGGINGRPVEYLTADAAGGGAPARCWRGP
jgi:branched-chain amino acid transport system substrate-binding protein